MMSCMARCEVLWGRWLWGWLLIPGDWVGEIPWRVHGEVCLAWFQGTLRLLYEGIWGRSDITGWCSRLRTGMSWSWWSLWSWSQSYSSCIRMLLICLFCLCEGSIYSLFKTLIFMHAILLDQKKANQHISSHTPILSSTSLRFSRNLLLIKRLYTRNLPFPNALYALNLFK